MTANTTPAPDLALALMALERARINLRAARVDAQDVPAYLAGARASRADELAEKIADALAHCERLAFMIEADIRYRGELMTATVVQLQHTNAILHEINYDLMARYINADPVNRAALDVRTSYVLYDDLGIFEFALADMPNDAVLQGLYDHTDVRYWSQGVV